VGEYNNRVMKYRMENITNIKAIIICDGDPWGIPKGGSTTFGKYMLKYFGKKVAIASPCDDDSIPFGKWVLRNYKDYCVPYLSLGFNKVSSGSKPFIPARVKLLLNSLLCKPQLRKIGVKNLMVLSPELMFSLSSSRWDSVCLYMAGVNNPVSKSRYHIFRRLDKCYDIYFAHVLNKTDHLTILACADEAHIHEFQKKYGIIEKRINLEPVNSYYDSDIFFPVSIECARHNLGLDLSSIVLVTVGRLNEFKGWKFLLNVISELRVSGLNVKLIFVGDGEDRRKIRYEAEKMRLSNQIDITGLLSQQDVSSYINASNICVFGSYAEGRSMAMIECIACGKPLVTTEVSGTKDIIKEGINGFIINDHNTTEFATKVMKALFLKDAKEASIKIATRYSSENFYEDIINAWPILS